MMVETNGRRELWCGTDKYCQFMGKGDCSFTATDFSALDYDKEKVSFSKVSVYEKSALAVTTNGQLYEWGESKIERQPDTQEENKLIFLNKPTEVNYFKDYNVIDAQ
jgi:hypothetical protein